MLVKNYHLHVVLHTKMSYKSNRRNISKIHLKFKGTGTIQVDLRGIFVR